MLKAKIVCNKNYRIGEIDRRIYGSFLEHMGRVIYTGIYEPDHPDADENGFRRDVLETVRRMGVTAVRYPGGNFVSTYHWEDGVGPKEKRPRKLELAWRSIETNQFGTNEFMQWAGKAHVNPILTVNLGTRQIEDAVHYLEYCNFPKGTVYSDLRREHGFDQPYKVKTWCLGNEMDGQWQIGHKTAHEYGKLAAETGKAMKQLDPSIELIACGSSLSTMESFPQWDLEVLEEAYDVIDYLSLHQYYGNQEKGTDYFLAQSLDMQNYITTVRAAAQFVKSKKRSAKIMKFSLDEWGVWSKPSDSVNQQIDKNPWAIAPAISEQIYSMEDALLFSEMMMVILRNCDIIHIACQSLLTNVSACIMTEPKGQIWLQTIYYPFYYFANYAKGEVLQEACYSDTYECSNFQKVPFLESVSVYNNEDQEIILFFVNRSEDESIETEVELQGFQGKEVLEGVCLTAEDKRTTNEIQHDAVIPKKADQLMLKGNVCRVILEPFSFTMYRVKI